jgi:hypothetical protein
MSQLVLQQRSINENHLSILPIGKNSIEKYLLSIYLISFLSRMTPVVTAVECRGGYNYLFDIWAVGLSVIEFFEL